MGGRFWALTVGVFGAYAFLIFHLYQLQVAKSSYYFAKAESQYAATNFDAAKRGTIYFLDKDGNRLPAALEKEFPVIYAVPKVVEDVQEASAQAALLLGRPAETFLKEFSKKTSSYVLLDKKPDAVTAARVKDAKVKGIYTENIYKRFYPFGPMASHVIGFVGPNSDNNSQSGKYGIEKLYEKDLSGASLSARSFITNSGKDITLTLDPTIQTEAEHVLKNLVSAFRAKGGSVLIADPKNGKILAMASAPNFDPNAYSSSSVKNFQNPVIEQIYEPGSVFKVLTMAVAIDKGKITPNTVFRDSGSLVLNGRTIRNWDLKAHGDVTMTQVIEGSLNTGAAYAQRQAGNEAFEEYMKKFGFGRRTGIELPGEINGDISRIGSNMPAINYATASFGQGVSATSIQVIQAISTIANGGKLMKPYVDADTGPKDLGRVMSEDTAKKVTAMMVSAVDNGKVAVIPGYSVAGKSGTAQVPDFVRGGYTKEVIATYVGFAPASDPRFIVLLKLDEPYGAPLAGQTVVPAFKTVAQFLLNYFNVPPDRIND